MANRRKVPKVSQGKPKQFPLNLQPDHEKGYPSFYSNYASVSHTPTEICIDFCIVAPPLQIDMEKKMAGIPVIARVLVPREMADGLVKAMQQQIQKQQSDRKKHVILIAKKADK